MKFNLSQGLNQKEVSISCFVFNCFTTRGDISCLCKQFGPRSGPTNVGPDLDPSCLTPGCYCKNPASKELNNDNNKV